MCHMLAYSTLLFPPPILEAEDTTRSTAYHHVAIILIITYLILPCMSNDELYHESWFIQILRKMWEIAS